MRQYPHPEDLGLNPEADRTEDLRSGKDDDPGAGTPRPSEPTLTKSDWSFIMTQLIDSPPLPPGAVCSDGWQGPDDLGQPWRIISGTDRRIDGVEGIIGTSAVQLADGSVLNHQHPIDAPVVYVGLGGEAFPVGRARELARAILAAADEIDGWVGR